MLAFIIAIGCLVFNYSKKKINPHLFIIFKSVIQLFLLKEFMVFALSNIKKAYYFNTEPLKLF